MTWAKNAFVCLNKASANSIICLANVPVKKAIGRVIGSLWIPHCTHLTDETICPLLVLLH